MKKYVTIRVFEDVQDENARYEVGMLYPRDGYTPTEDRIRELSTTANIRGERLIVELKEYPEPIAEDDSEVEEEEEKVEVEKPKKSVKRTPKNKKEGE